VAATRVGDQIRRENLESHLALQARVDGTIDLAHATRAECAEDAISANRRARGKTHWNLRRAPTGTERPACEGF